MVSPVSGANLQSYYQGQTALSMLSSSSLSTDASSTNASLLNFLNAKAGIPSADTPDASANAPLAPWNAQHGVPSVSDAVQNALSGQQFVDPSTARLSAPAGVSARDYQNLFALYQGLNTLNDLAQTAAGTASTGSNYAPAQLQAAFASGMAQVQNFLSDDPFKAFNLVAGKVSESTQSSVGVPNGAYQNYTTGIIGVGQPATALKSLQGDVKFTITVANKYANTTYTKPDGTKVTTTTIPPTVVDIDLSEMGARTRSIDNVVNFINAKLKDAKVASKFAAANLGKSNVTKIVDGKSTTTASRDPQWGLTINGNSTEQISFSAPVTSPAVYIGMKTGGAKTYATASTTDSPNATSSTLNTTAEGEQFIKLQTDPTIPPSPNASLPAGGVFSKTLPDGVTSIQTSATAPDGSVYMLADASTKVGSAPVPGTQGVALLKYDPMGKLLYSKVLPDVQNGTGYSLAVNTDGSVAVAGTNSTPETVTAAGLPKAAATSAFVQVFDNTGVPTWSQTVPALAGASAASGVAFGADGSVYLSGATTGSVGNQIPKSDADEFIQGFDKTGKATFSTQFGSKNGVNSSAGMVYDAATNSLFTAGQENGKAVVRSFVLNGSHQPTPGPVRTLGSATNVVGIGLSGSQIVVAGNTTTSTITSGTVVQPYAGLGDGFVATISTSMTAGPSDTVTYLGAAGQTQKVTALTVSGGKAYVTGTIAGDIKSLAAKDATEGFVTAVDAAVGGVTYGKTFPGANGQATPTAISVSATGASVLDQLGLPLGALNTTSSGLIVAATPIKAGSSFYIRTTPGGAQSKITITAKDTLDTLVTKMNFALGGQGSAKAVKVGPTSQISITPNDGGFIELDSQLAASDTPFRLQGAVGVDILAALGLSSGVVRKVNTINGLTDVKQTRQYGLALPSNLSLTTTDNAQHASNAIQAAMYAVKKAYQELVTPPTMASEQAAKAASDPGSVPKYLSNQIANYSAGLQRLLANQANNANNGGPSLF